QIGSGEAIDDRVESRQLQSVVGLDAQRLGADVDCDLGVEILPEEFAELVLDRGHTSARGSGVADEQDMHFPTVAPPGGPGQGRGEFRRFPHSTFSLCGFGQWVVGTRGRAAGCLWARRAAAEPRRLGTYSVTGSFLMSKSLRGEGALGPWQFGWPAAQDISVRMWCGC